MVSSPLSWLEFHTAAPESAAKLPSSCTWRPKKATVDSDVDIFMILRPGSRGVDSLRIRRATFHDFPMDLIVMSERRFGERLKEGDFFLMDIVEQGVVLYEENHV